MRSPLSRNGPLLVRNPDCVPAQGGAAHQTPFFVMNLHTNLKPEGKT